MNLIRRMILRKKQEPVQGPDLATERERLVARNRRIVQEIMQTRGWVPTVAFEAGSLNISRIDMSAKFGPRGLPIRAEVTPGDLRVKIWPHGPDAAFKEIRFGYEERAAFLRGFVDGTVALPSGAAQPANPVRRVLAEARVRATHGFLSAQADRAQMIADIPNGPKTSRPTME